MRFISTVTLLILGTFTFVQAQSTEGATKALSYIQDKSEEWQLLPADLQELIVTDNYTTKKTGTRHIYVTQAYQGIPIYNAIQSLAISKAGKVFSVGKTRFVANLAEQVKSRQASISPEQSINALLKNIGRTSVQSPRLISSKSPNEYLFAGEGIAKQDIPVRLVYERVADGQLRLAYQVQLDVLNSSDWWNARIDAGTGEVLAKSNYTISCQFDKQHYHLHNEKCVGPKSTKRKSSTSVASGLPGSYRVVPFPIESPNHGDFVMEVEPADPVASPFGWHDINGQAGAEYTITRGNNVHAYQDQNNSNNSSGDEPNGGANLVFDYPYTPDDDPNVYTDAAVVNLFYWINKIHDFSYSYGFDEAAGNFQQNNYGNGGAASDYIHANAQDGFFGPTPSLNNANYSGGGDGSIARIQMFLWQSSKLLNVLEPASIAGEYDARPAQYGPDVPSNPIEAEVVEYSDGLYSPLITDACEPAINGDELMGKIALIDRGGCFFQQKTLNAEAAGALAVIVCNYEETANSMGGVPDLPAPGIPSISMGASDCSIIRAFAGTGLKVSYGQQPDSGIAYLDGDFDNGIVAHEKAHGISNRITGGPGQGGCLDNNEQMGEGWSDFFSLIMTTDETFSGEDKRAVGTFVFQQAPDGRGIRRYPYSTDMNINPLTYADVAANPEVHALGEVWTSVLWDMYWALVDKYDFDADLINGSGGNNMAIQLVMDGMKIQGCNPGFVDGRDAILAADEMLTGGDNRCLIWEVFARRGVGIDADQGSTFSGSDQIVDFEPLPICVQELKMSKTVTPLVKAGNSIQIDIEIINHHPDAQSGIQINDELPEGLEFVAGSANLPVTVNGNQLTFEVGALAFSESKTLSYQVTTDPNKPSISLNFDDLENGTDKWLFLPVEGNNLWAASNESPFEGSTSMRVPSTSAESQQIVFTKEPINITGNNPVLRVYHNYRTEPGQDGGAIQVTDDFDTGNWANVGNLLLRGQYNGPIDYQTFVIPNFQVFSGTSDEYISSYIDLNEYNGKSLYFRFNFATSEGDGVVAPGNGFWAFDNFEFMDLVSYNWETCMSSDGGATVCHSAPEGGTIIDTDLLNATEDIHATGVQLKLFPNPASDYFTLALQSESIINSNWSILSVDGRVLKKENFFTNGGRQQLTLSSADLAPGLYFVKVATPRGEITEKLIIQ